MVAAYGGLAFERARRPEIVRDNLGHANLSTTSIDLHTEDDARHDATDPRLCDSTQGQAI
ncbi:hypothetical protein CFU_0476 [Collimonas fungivorans Ter331]|uniref:Uncharacterized protein n=1 Tax=Collimonas fungivorans (strain Ter331) TaxID=1005048 RepID=G0AGI3_COLFT|nr:hypothetical protein CFU_0476 [Collimonas fungivorans Ter331]